MTYVSKPHPGRVIAFEWDPNTDVVEVNQPLTPAPKVIITLPPNDPILRRDGGLADGLSVRFRLEDFDRECNVSGVLGGGEEITREESVGDNGEVTVTLVGEELRIMKIGNFHLFVEVFLTNGTGGAVRIWRDWTTLIRVRDW
jgi:hypothetical protein